MKHIKLIDTYLNPWDIIKLYGFDYEKYPLIAVRYTKYTVILNIRNEKSYVLREKESSHHKSGYYIISNKKNTVIDVCLSRITKYKIDKSVI
jgi:hypothetical protein